MQKTIALNSSFDDLPLSLLIIEPEGAPKGIVQIAHGMAEHKNRYEEFMSFLASHGYIAACNDHRGHGDSVKSEKEFGFFGDYSGKAIVEDTVQVSEYLKTAYPDLPLTLFGHSMGSLVVRCCIQQHDDLYDKLVVCGSPGQNSKVGTAIFLAKCIRFFCGGKHRSKLLKNLSLGKGIKQFAAEGENAWLSVNQANVAAYDADEKCGYTFTVNGYENLFKLLKRTYAKKNYEVKNPDLPILFIAGANDPVIVDQGRWFQAISFMQALGYTGVKGSIYQDMRHEILNEEGRLAVYDDVLAFIEN